MSLHKIVQEWDDSAGLEAFQNAKFRYWAKINNHQCDIPLPDPDMYIEEVEHNAVIDPEVIADLYVEAQQPAPVTSSFLCMNEPIRATRCDVVEHDSGCIVKGKSCNAWNSTSWDMNGAHSSKWNTGDGGGKAYVKNNSCENERDNAWNNHIHKTSGPHGNSNNEAGRKHGRNKDGVGCFGSRKRSLRLNTNFYPANSSWRNFRGHHNRIDHSEQTVYGGRPTSQQWKPTETIGSGNNQASNDCGALIK